MKVHFLALILCAVPAFAALDSAPLAHTDKTVTGQPIVAPEHPTVIATMVTFQPGDKTSPHKHPWPHYGYVLEGVLTITNAETGQSFDLKAGQFLVEMQNTTHVGENKGTVPVKILIVDSVPEGVTNNTIPVQP
jgi:quercetin dioxygenase-like cupin family protein